MIPEFYTGDYIKCPYCGGNMTLLARNENEFKIRLTLKCLDQNNCAYGCNLGYVEEIITGR